MNVGKNLKSPHHILVVVKGFSHPHEDDVAQVGTFREILPGFQNLVHDFRNLEVADQPHLPCHAEITAHSAADLG